MRKIVSLFQRNYDGDRLVRDEVVPGAEWVTEGKGTATQKWDGTAVLFRGGNMYRRYEVAPGKEPPGDFEAANEVDPNTGKQQGWVLVTDDPEDRWHREALQFHRDVFGETPADGTYELCGPKIQGNPERLDVHMLLPHGCEMLVNVPTTYRGLKDWLATRDLEGIVWWRDINDPDSDKVKIKKKDFGLPRMPIVPSS